jgi:hypothetical protein
VPYRDDRQVKLLYVDLDEAWAREDSARTGSIFIIARRARDVMADLQMAARVSGEQYDEEEDSPFRLLQLPDEPEQDWLTAASADLTPVEQFLADYARYRYVADLQEPVLSRSNAILASEISAYLGGLANVSASAELAAIFAKSQAEKRELILSNPVAPPLPGLPQVMGDSRARQGSRQHRAYRPAHCARRAPSAS